MKVPLVLAAQPTMDRTVVIGGFSAGKAHRISRVEVLPSGKALNVARSLIKLGESVRVIALLAGHTGMWINNKLEEMGIPCKSIWMEGENRLAYSIYDPETEQITELIEDTDGPVTEPVYLELKQSISEELLQSSVLVLSGRAPNGMPFDSYKSFIEMASLNSVPVYMDCYGALFEQALHSSIEVVKINAREAGNFLGRDLTTPQSVIDSAYSFLEFGLKTVIITMSKHGSVIMDENECFWATPPLIHGAAIGSGDAMMAGIVKAAISGHPLYEMIRLGVALGAANVLHPGAGVFEIEDVYRLIEKVDVRRVKMGRII